MKSSREIILEGLLVAMKAEAEGQHFYLMAASSTQDPQGQRVFMQLADEEQQHLRFLKTQAESVRESGRPRNDVELGQPMALVGSSPIFSKDIRARLGDAHFEMTALSVGIQLELSAERYYLKQSEGIEDETIRAFYGGLAAWEAGHYRALLAQQDFLKEEYWAASGFSPF
ncbi:MAG: ferritin family protein [Polyangia bacterium]|nr:ferritin family protein [Polyangia bacterium]